MKLKVNDFAKIKSAEIDIDGITVIAGQNNTGKSTIGKIIFSLFNSLNNMEEKINKQRKQEIYRFSNRSIRNYYVHLQHSKDSNKNLRLNSRLRLPDYEELINLIDGVTEYQDVYDTIYDSFRKDDSIIENDQNFNELVDDISKKILSIIELPNRLVMREIITRYFNKIFSKQINCLRNEVTKVKLELTIKDKIISTTFNNNECDEIVASFNVLHEAYYIDDPFIIDELSEDYDGDFSIKGYMISKLKGKHSEVMDGLFDAVIAKEKLEEVYKKINMVIEGELLFNSDNFALTTNFFQQPIKLNNLSTGLKSFIIIKILLEKGILKEKDVLILDEPEIHLYPEWQLVYAEIIVLLQKIFNLSIVVTTHSSNFLEAIDYFSKKHCIDEKCKYYLANVEDGMSTFKNVSGNLEEIYSQMIKPSVLLDKLKYEMDNKEDE